MLYAFYLSSPEAHLHGLTTTMWYKGEKPDLFFLSLLLSLLCVFLCCCLLLKQTSSYLWSLLVLIDCRVKEKLLTLSMFCKKIIKDKIIFDSTDIFRRIIISIFYINAIRLYSNHRTLPVDYSKSLLSILASKISLIPIKHRKIL